MKYGYWTVISKETDSKRHWLCVCKCGKESLVDRYSLVRKKPSKGCLMCTNKLSEVRTTHGFSRKISGKLKNTFYTRWKAMRRRCDYEKYHEFHLYGGRGIKVCERWQTFENFRDDMWTEFKEKEGNCSIDRIDNDGNYEPVNCRWATAEQQMANRRNSRRITLFEKTMTLQEWARFIGVKRELISNRIKRGWSKEDALLTNPRQIKKKVC